MKGPRGLSADEAEAWARVAATVRPLAPQPARSVAPPPAPTPAERPPPAKDMAAPPRPRRLTPGGPPAQANASPPVPGGLDSHWERRLRAGGLTPDVTLDLHEHSLDAAYQRLLGGLDLARETGARVVLVIAGRERAAPAADRAGRRGAIRAKLLDWLAASRHAPAIAAIRRAHRRHGGEGALYIVLRRAR